MGLEQRTTIVILDEHVQLFPGAEVRLDNDAIEQASPDDATSVESERARFQG